MDRAIEGEEKVASPVEKKGETEHGSGDEDDTEMMDPCEWVQGAVSEGLSPRDLILSLLGADCPVPADVSEAALWSILLSLLSTPDPRPKLPQFNSVADVARLISTARNIMVLTGAGISVSCGIPDFRSPHGVYATLHREFPELPDPQAMFDIHYFNDDPRPFFRFVKEIYPGQFSPSPSHLFISALEKRGQLLRHYTQNIDTLEQAAGISRVVYCHGSFATATCCQCGQRVDGEVIRNDIMKQEVPMCQRCAVRGGEGVMKPDIIFFGEGLPDEFHKKLEEDKGKADLLVVMGSSLKVRPVSLIPSLMDSSVPQVLINREHLPHMTFDIELLGYSDTIVAELCHQLGVEWEQSVGVASGDAAVAVTSPEKHVHLFPGAIWKDSRQGHTHLVTSDPPNNTEHATDDILNPHISPSPPPHSPSSPSPSSPQSHPPSSPPPNTLSSSLPHPPSSPPPHSVIPPHSSSSLSLSPPSHSTTPTSPPPPHPPTSAHLHQSPSLCVPQPKRCRLTSDL